jgi:hypothetical protein
MRLLLGALPGEWLELSRWRIEGLQVFDPKCRDEDVGYGASAQFLKCRSGALADLVGVEGRMREERSKQ